jgi:hypothetical protein
MRLCAFAGDKNFPQRRKERKEKQKISVIYAAISNYLCNAGEQ